MTKTFENLLRESELKGALTLTRRADVVFIQEESGETKPHVIYICTIENHQNGATLQVTTTQEWASLSDIIEGLLRTFDEFEYPDWVSELEETHGSQVARHARRALETRESDLERVLDPKFDQFLAASKEFDY